MVTTQQVVLSSLVGLAAWQSGSSSTVAASTTARNGTITNDTYFYGQSPPIYPSPEMTGGSQWAAAYQKAKSLVSQMTLEEKVNVTGGVDLRTGCSGSIYPNKRLNFPGMCVSDAGNGLRNTDFVNAYPAGIHVGTSWNKDLARRRGAAMGGEFRRKGVNVLLGPMVGPAWRVVRGGRNWEGFSADPYLSGSLVAQTIQGVQSQGVQTSLKHYIANEQELNRNPSGEVEALSSNVDDKTMHEVYLWPFQDGVRAGTGNIMCSYQRINNSYGCANSKTLNGLLKTELGFQGFVMSDWGAQHAGVATALAGMDMVMPSGDGFWGDHLVKAVKNGSVPESRVTDMATRILTTWYQFGQDAIFDKPGIGMPLDVRQPHETIEGRDHNDRPVLLDGAIEGHVLVKNTKNTLPLKSPRMLSLFGYSARSADSLSPGPGDLLINLWRFGLTSVSIDDVLSSQLGGQQARYPNIAVNGTIMGGGGSGAGTPAVFVAPYDAISMRAAQDDTAIFHDFGMPEPAVVPSTDTCIVFGNAWASEGYDRPSLYDNFTDSLVKTVADQCNKTVVVLHNAGPRIVESFVDHPNVTAIIFAHLPGRDSGTSLVKLLYGEAGFSGKLSYTVARKESDYGHLLSPDEPAGKFQKFPQSNFTEGVYLDYKYFEMHNITPRYEFGFGLSYTTFSLANLVIQRVNGGNSGEWAEGAIIPGGQEDLFDNIATVTVDVSNTGNMAGAEVPQLYVGIPGGPAKQLRGFEKRFLAPGTTVPVEFPLTRRDLSVWDTTAQKWRLQRGQYNIYVGTSSRDVPLKGSLTIN
ncbi:beta glucosidase (glycoside hydrolase family 3) [Metarhizium robertsii]|uniref:beta-glucosidase n=2 Tax=Metarhizium robertsii TaxID=568076 RepID=E9F003_METRA|nr:glycoside hydrolase family 3 protein [Metarhizium robertsii ARSEF 23]EFY98463.1 glycoside hydrolase family 3 protein [Metarhizium robertsii ARSEF 23]EXV04405.1 beta glucosidase (glycoside hydrolase family 3) [Metarhizium robertsii]